MKVLLTSTAAVDQRLDGLIIFAESLARHLVAAGHECALFVSDLDRHPAAAELSEGAVGPLKLFRAALPAPRTVAEALDRPGCDALFRRAVEGFRPDLVHFHSLELLSAGMIEAVQAAGRPAIMTVHDFYLLCPAARLVDLGGRICPGPDLGRRCAMCLAASGNLIGRYRGRLRWLLRRWDVLVRHLHGPALQERFRRLRELVGRLGAVICPSRFMAESLAAVELVPGARVIPNGSELAPLPLPDRRLPVVGMLARHSVSKGTHLLVEALRLVPQLDVHVEIHGDGDAGYLATVKHQARGDGRLSFAGPFRQEDAARIHAGLDALVVPSIWPENSPLVMADALAAGRPCVAPSPGGAAEMLGGGRYGLAFAVGNPRSLADALTKLIGESGLLDELRRNIAADCPVPTRAEVARRYERLYSELTGGGKRAEAEPGVGP